MNQNDFKTFTAMLSAVGELYGKSQSELGVSLYWNALKEFDLSAVRQAFDRHVKNPDTGQFMPKPADLIRMMSGTTQDSALVAWAKVDRTVRQVGPYCDVVFDDAVIHRVLHDMGGWMALATKTEAEWPFAAKEFENRYRGYRMRNEIPEYPRILIGLASAQNQRAGFKANQHIVYVGDREKAEAVARAGTDKVLLGFSRVESTQPQIAA